MAEALEYYDAMSRHLSELERNPQAAEDELHVCQWEPYEQEHNADGLVIVNGTAVTVERALQNMLAYLVHD